jgi:hypothetical protein
VQQILIKLVAIKVLRCVMMYDAEPTGQGFVGLVENYFPAVEQSDQEGLGSAWRARYAKRRCCAVEHPSTDMTDEQLGAALALFGWQQDPGEPSLDHARAEKPARSAATAHTRDPVALQLALGKSERSAVLDTPAGNFVPLGTRSSRTGGNGGVRKNPRISAGFDGFRTPYPLTPTFERVHSIVLQCGLASLNLLYCYKGGGTGGTGVQARRCLGFLGTPAVPPPTLGPLNGGAVLKTRRTHLSNRRCRARHWPPRPGRRQCRRRCRERSGPPVRRSRIAKESRAMLA